MSCPNWISVPTPYLPMVKAIAPNAPIGARRIIKLMMPKMTCEKLSITLKISWPLLPRRCSAKPNSTANSSTCKMLPLANAPITLPGITSMRKATIPCSLACSAYTATALASSVEGSTFIPAPGCTTLTIIRPIISASVLTTSK